MYAQDDDDFYCTVSLTQQVTGTTSLGETLNEASRWDLLYRSFRFLGAWLFYAAYSKCLALVRACLRGGCVCLGRIMGREGRCFSLGHDGGGRLLPTVRIALSIFFFLLVCFGLLLLLLRRGVESNGELKRRVAEWGLILAERLFSLCVISNTCC